MWDAVQRVTVDFLVFIVFSEYASQFRVGLSFDKYLFFLVILQTFVCVKGNGNSTFEKGS